MEEPDRPAPAPPADRAGAAEPADHLRLALDAGGFGTWRWDLHRGDVTWDPQMERLFGLEPGTFDGTFESWRSLVHPDDRERVLSAVQDAVAAKGSYQLAHRVVLPDGAVRWLEASGGATLDAAGEVTGTIGCCHDISARAEADLERDQLSALVAEALDRERFQRERLELVSAVNEALEDPSDLAELMRRVTASVIPRFADWCVLHVFDGPHDRIPVVEIAHRDPAMVRYARELQERHPFDPDAPTGVAAVMRTRRPEFHHRIDARAIAEANLTAEAARVVEDLAIRSAITVPLAKGRRVDGAMQFIVTHDHRAYTEEDLAIAQVIASRIAATLDSRQLRQERARTLATDAALARLGRRLAASAAEAEVMAVILEEAPRAMDARRAAVGLISDAESLAMHGFHRDVLRIDEAEPVAEALRRADTVLRPRDGWGRSPRTTHQGDGTGALVASPLYDDRHHPMGVLLLEWDAAVPFDEDDLNAVETLSRLCGQAIVRAQLAEHTASMAELGAAMAAAKTTADVALLVRDHASSILGATVANIRLLAAERSVLVAVLPSEVPSDFSRRYEQVGIDEDLPLSRSVRADETFWFGDIRTYRDQFPAAADETEAAGFGATAVIPLHDSAATVVGAVTLAWRAPMPFDDRFRFRVLSLCDVVGQTLERVRLYEAEHAVVASMQRRLLAPLPHVEGLSLLARYEPAASAVGMGGDWYEVTPLGDGTAIAIIGDVVGHGVEAVAAMAQIQHLLTGLLRAGTPPEAVIATACSMLAGPDHTYATALLLHLDPAQQRVGYVSAGHPFALIRTPDGQVQRLDQNQQPMIGLRVESRALQRVPFPPGSVLLAYTDGLIERRGEPIIRSIDRLAAHLADLDPAALGPELDRLIEAVHQEPGAGPATNDDIAVLLVHASEAPTA